MVLDGTLQKEECLNMEKLTTLILIHYKQVSYEMKHNRASITEHYLGG